MNAAGWVVVVAFVAASVTPTPPVPSDRLAVLVAAQVAQPASATHARGPYFRSTITLTVAGGPVWLASTANGDGELRTDDAATLSVLRPDGSVRVWAHDYRDPKSGAIIGVRPQDISALFLRGVHTVTLTLNDALPPVYSSGAYFLIVNAITAAMPAATASRDSAAISRVSESPTLNPADLIQPSGLHPTPTPSSIDPSGNVRNDADPAPVTSETPAAPEPDAGPFRVEWLAVIACPALVVAILASRRAQRDKQMVLAGFVHLTDTQTGERLSNVDLTAFGAEAGVLLDPLGIAQPSKGWHPIATFAATLNGVVIRTAAGDGKPMTQTVLGDAMELELGHRLRLEYRCPLASSWMSNVMERESGGLKSAQGQ